MCSPASEKASFKAFSLKSAAFHAEENGENEPKK